MGWIAGSIALALDLVMLAISILPFSPCLQTPLPFLIRILAFLLRGALPYLGVYVLCLYFPS